MDFFALEVIYSSSSFRKKSGQIKKTISNSSQDLIEEMLCLLAHIFFKFFLKKVLDKKF